MCCSHCGNVLSGRCTAEFMYYRPQSREGFLQKPKTILIERAGEGSRSWAREQWLAGAVTWGTWRPGQLLSFAQDPVKPVTGTLGGSSVSWHLLWQHHAKEKQDLPESAKEKVKPVSLLLFVVVKRKILEILVTFPSALSPLAPFATFFFSSGLIDLTVLTD